jgi:D-xylose transport system substrate-binding protein
VYDEFTDEWSSTIAYQNMKAFLENGNTVDGIVAANDGTASGVIQALEEVGLAGKIPVSGQDASLGGCQRVVQGTQTVTIYKPLKTIAYQSAKLAVELAKGQDISFDTTTVNNGLAEINSILLDVTAVTKENMDETIIADGFHSREEVYG